MKKMFPLVLLALFCCAGISKAQNGDTKKKAQKQKDVAAVLNPLIQQANDAINAKDWQAAVSPLQQLIELDPDNWQHYSGLGDAQMHLEQYVQAAETYEHGIWAAEDYTPVDPKNPSTDPVKKKAGIGHMLTMQGNCYLKLQKKKEAIADYTKAAEVNPNPALAYFNICATLYNEGDKDGAIPACDKALAVDPNRADAYFIKGSLLIASSQTDKNGQVTPPPGTVEALKKYLELAPDGPHVKDVKDMLKYLGVKVEATGGDKK